MEKTLKAQTNLCPINANKFVRLAKPISNKVEEIATFKDNPVSVFSN